MNSIATRMMMEKGVNIVGALARSPEKVGKDLGEVASLGYETGVIVEDDPERVLSTRSVDIATIAVSSYMHDMYDHLRVCAEHGTNAVTIAEECLYPWRTSPALTAELDELAKRGGVTLTGSGHQDAYWVNLVSMLMGTSHRIDTVTGQASWNVDDASWSMRQSRRRATPRCGRAPPRRCAGCRRRGRRSTGARRSHEVPAVAGLEEDRGLPEGEDLVPVE
jgi:2,4-diaminopentanoate dehydrogenase